MNLKQYLLKVEKTYKFRIKALFPLDDDDCMALLEKALGKYRPVSVSAPKKTILQTNPLGFTGVKAAEVYIVDIELAMPTTSKVLAFDLREILGIQQTSETLKVFSEHELSLEETSEPCDITDDEGEKHDALLTSDEDCVEEAKFTDYFGDDYNTRFLDVLKKVEEERKDKAKVKQDAPHPITKWADQPKGDEQEEMSAKDKPAKSPLTDNKKAK